MTETTPSTIDYDALRERLKSGDGPEYWRSLEELAETPEFHEHLKAEFASQADKWIDPVTRRNFLKLMSASLAFSGLTACGGFKKPDELILPYVKQPEQMVLGKPLFFATAMPFNGYGYPILVESHEGRPTKIEGNHDHPSSKGAAYAWMQAAILSLYDPDRAQVITNAGEIRDWSDMLNDLRAEIGKAGEGGAGLRILTETITSPTLAWQMGEVLKQYPAAKWVQYDPCGRENVREGARLAFGDYADTHYRFEEAQVVLALDSDFMMEGPGGLRYSKDLSARRRVRSPEDGMARLYAVESTLTNTGSVADHRLPLKPSQVEAFARAVAAAVGVAGAGAEAAFAPNQRFFDAVVRDLQANKGKAVVVAGADSSPVLHSLAHAINGAIGAAGQTVVYTEPVEARPANQTQELAQLVEEMKTGNIGVLIILGGNPVYNAPTDLKFADALKRVGLRVHHAEYINETSQLCHWHVPQSHFLETWSDIRTDDGTVCIVQPLIAPLYTSRSWHEFLGALTGQAGQSSYDTVQAYWKQQRPGDNFEKFWRRALHDGFIPDSAAAPKQVTARTDASAIPPAQPSAGLELILRPDPSIQDGRFANNGWLQELPKPFTKITWDNAALISPKTAVGLGLQTEDVVTLQTELGSVTAPVMVMAGHADDCVTVHLGYGRTKAGRVGLDVDNKPHGFNAFQLRGSKVAAVGSPVTLKKNSGQTYKLARTQLHFNIDNPDIQPPVPNDLPKAESVQLKQRGLVRRASLEEYKKHPDFVHEQGPHVPHADLDFYAGAWEYKGYAWGMAIDTSVCNGCNACVIACQAENNIPVVGKEEVRRQHEMHWLRIDQYYRGGVENPEVYNQPLPCMHCENAPCEVVCPVNATVHSDQGTNDMVYNRCVGTRFCSNNCPYKVRRFNWFQYTDFTSPLKKMLNNPDVTVRSRGVMEKCTYCIQRISHGRIEAENEGRRVRDGEVITACAQTCPTDAIVFGDLNDPNSQVTKWRNNSLNYGLLVDLNTKPRTTYLAAVRNENPDLEKEA